MAWNPQDNYIGTTGARRVTIARAVPSFFSETMAIASASSYRRPSARPPDVSVLPVAIYPCSEYRNVILKRIQPVSIHGQLSLDIYADPEDPEGELRHASRQRIGAAGHGARRPRDPPLSDGSVTQITK